MSVRIWSCSLAAPALAVLALASGCAHSEDEWRARLREVEDLKAEIARTREKHGDASKACGEAATRLEKIERDLRESGVDPENVKSNIDMQARALEEHRRRAEQRGAARARFAILRDRLAPLVKDGVTVSVRMNRVVIALPGDTVFDAGRETVRREGKDLLAKIAEVIRSEPTLERRAWQVAGHLDAAKPGGAFRDGLGLSAMRAREVVALLREPVGRGGGGLRAAAWSVAGHGDADPVATGDAPELKAKNRRVEIVLLPAPEEMLDLTNLDGGAPQTPGK